MRYPKIIDELNDSVRLVLTIHSPIAFGMNYVKMNADYLSVYMTRIV